MKLLRPLPRLLPWLNLPAYFLLTLLQRTPVVQLSTSSGQALIASPTGSILRAAAAAFGSLGAIHSLAGATQLVASVPNPFRTTLGVPITTPIVITVTGAQTPPQSFNITGPIPPGLSVSGLTGTGGRINASSVTLTGTPTTGGSYTITIRAYELTNLGGTSSVGYPYSIAVADPTPVAPQFTLQPVSQTLTAGANATFTVAATGTPSPAFQWRKDGVAIPGATATSYSIPDLPVSAAGAYSAVATNASGTVTSNSASLTVRPAPVSASAPVFTTQPTSTTADAGSTITLSSAATNAQSYRWQRNNVDLPNATTDTLTLAALTSGDAGNYRVIATNPVGSTTSNTATLNVRAAPVTPLPPTGEVSRLVNLSVRAPTGPGARVLTVGASVGPLNLSGTLPLVIRAIGPTLGTFGVPGVLADPVLTLNAAGVTTPLATNDNWGGASTITSAFAAVGAFALAPASLDSAALATPSVGGLTVQVTGKGSASGVVLAEIYDNSTNRTASSPRLVNLSTLTQIDSGASLTVGFVLRGATTRTVLVRGVGPSLGRLGVPDTMADPKLELFNNDTGAALAENDNWSGDPALAAAATSVGAFPLADAATKDAVLLVSLSPGTYSARLSGVGTSAGTAIIEVYELP